MIVVKHHPVQLGWEFTVATTGLAGGGRTLDRSIDAAEHAARIHLSEIQGYPVEHEYARNQLRHAIECAELQPA